jgi:hypothetical protein
MTLLASTASDDHQLFTTTVSGATDLTALVHVSGAIGDYDWSGMSLQFERSPDSTINLPTCTLISETHAVCANHAGYSATPIAAGDEYHFRTPAGTIATGIVAEKTQIGSLDVALIRFTADPSVELARYPILLEQEVMATNTFWAPEHNSIVLLRECTTVTDDYIFHDDGGWGGTPASSGRPCMVPLDDGSLAILGTHYTAGAFPRLDYHHSLIQAELDGFGETVDTVEVGDAVPDTDIDLTTNLFARWRLNGTVNDSSGNARHGTLQGAAAFVSGGRTGGTCLSTVNANDYMTCGTGNPGGTFSVGGWVKWNGVSSAVQVLFCKCDTFAVGDMEWQMNWTPGTTQIGANRAGAGASPTWSNSDSVDLAFQADRWEHVFFTYDGTNLTLYRNGVQISPARAYAIGDDNAALIKIGANAANAFQFEGFFEDVWIFENRVLTAEEVVGVMNAGDITVTSPQWRQIIQRDTTTLLGDIDISGFYDPLLGTPTDIQAKHASGSYASLSNLIISGGVFNGTLTDVPTGVGDLTVKRTDTNATFVQPLVGVGRNFLVIGQSNAEGLGTNQQTYSGAATCSRFTEDHSTWRAMADPSDSDSGSGSIWVLLANLLSAADTTCPLSFHTAADVGTGLIPLEGDAAEWDKATSGASYLDMQARLSASGVNAIEQCLWHQGEAEAYNPVTTAEYYAAMVEFMENISVDVPGSPRVRIAQLGQIPNTEPVDEVHAIRQAQQLLWSHSLALPGPACYDINLADESGDSIHFKTNTELQTMADRWYACIAGGSPPRIVSASATPGGTSLVLRYDQTLVTTALGATAFTVTGSVSGAIVVSAAAAAGKLVTLTLADPTIAGETLTVIFASGNTGQGVTVPTVSATLLAPAQTFIGGAGGVTGDSASFTVHTHAHFSPAHFPVSYLGH